MFVGLSVFSTFRGLSSVNSRKMSSHLSHKLPWHLLVDYVTPYKNPGISLPVGTCDRIHITNRKVELQVKNHGYIQQEDICTDSTCVKSSQEKIFYKNRKKTKIFSLRESGARLDEEKCKKFFIHFEKAVLEFAQTEMATLTKDLEYEVNDSAGLSSCDNCNRFITLLEFGDKKKLLEYSNEEITCVFSCRHGGQANLPYLLHFVLIFYLNMNIILHADLKKEDWPRDMKPGSFFRSELLHPNDGQTFLPQSRKYLSEAMIDLGKTKILNRNLFRFIYFYVMMNLKIDKNYSLREELSSWLIRRVTF